MARGIHNIQDVPAWRLCMGCGACYAACTKGGVGLVNIVSEGIRPKFDPEICSSCTDCLSVCPGRFVDADQVMHNRPKTTRADHEFGQVLEIWEGHATDPEIRHRASSGGLISALSLYCLEQGGMSFALHSAMDPDKPWLNRTVQSRTREEILARAGSRYAPASPCEGLRAIEENDTPCVFIGKPCDAAGANMLRRQRPDLDRNLGLVLSFCCAGTPNTQGTEELLEGMEVRREAVARLRYRGEGWPGGFGVSVEGETEERFIPYADAWGALTKHVAFRCRLCPDGLGRLADITCGDAWESYKPDSGGDAGPGLSIVLVRTDRGREVLHGAMRAGYVELRRIDSRAVLEAEPNLLHLRKELFGRLLTMRLFRMPVPQYEGFSLLRSWLGLSSSRKLRSLLGTMIRILRRKWYCREHR